jgi:hypothetical protein
LKLLADASTRGCPEAVMRVHGFGKPPELSCGRPASWRMNRPPRPVVKATIGGNAPSKLGLQGLLDFQM